MHSSKGFGAATLADTSVWVAFLRSGASGPGARMKSLIESGQVVICGQVAAELAAGAAEAPRSELWSRLHDLPWVGLDRLGWLRVGEVKYELDRSGRSVPLADLEIAVTAARAGVDVWALDSDFERIADVMPELRLVR